MINIIYLICFLLPGTDVEMEPLNVSENQQGKTYIGQIQADCFCQVNILDGQTNPTILIKIRSSYLLICFAWPLQTHSIDGVLLSIWNKRQHRYSFANSYLENTPWNEQRERNVGTKEMIVNFPFICSNISAPHAYGVCYSRLLVPIWISVIEDCCL